MKIEPFKKPIYTTRPILPDLKELTQKLQEVFASQWLTNDGACHQLLEEKLKQVLRVPHLSLLNNGTTALMVACHGLDLSGEVITTPFTFPATPHVLTWNQTKPVFCDIDPVTMNIDPQKIEPLITSRTTGILAVHVFGVPCDIEAIRKLATRYGLKVIYDAAHVFEVEMNGVGIGNFGDASVFSFHATKLFHTAEGGAVTTRNIRLKKKIDLLKNFGIKNEEEVIMTGINGKMNEIQAAIGLLVLNYREKERRKRKRILNTYGQCLRGLKGITFLDEQPKIKNSYQFFVIRINEKEFGRSRDYVYEKFKEYNIFTRKRFYPLCSDYPHYKDFPSADPSHLPVANKVSKEVLTMPFYGELSVNDVEKIGATLESFKR